MKPLHHFLVWRFVRKKEVELHTVEGYLPSGAVIAEMAGSAGDVSKFVEVDPQVLEAVVDPADSAPMFITIQVLAEGKSNNKRRYTREIIASIVAQVNQKRVDGYWGHLKDEDRATKAPEPTTIWLGAAVKEVDGKLCLFAKGYVLPSATALRSYLRSAKAIGKNVAVSIYGLTRKFSRDTDGAVVPEDITLESIDWARSGSEGMPNLGRFAVTSEMTGDSDVNQEDAMEKIEAIKTVSASELKEHNPQVVSEMTAEALAPVEAERDTVIAEMTEVRTLVGATDEKSAASVISEMIAENRNLKLDEELRSKVAVPGARKVIKKMVIAEMSDGADVTSTVDAVLGSEEGKAVVKEMLATEPPVAPKTAQPAAEARKYTKKN